MVCKVSNDRPYCLQAVVVAVVPSRRAIQKIEVRLGFGAAAMTHACTEGKAWIIVVA